jgi:hypothetical protein
MQKKLTDLILSPVFWQLFSIGLVNGLNVIFPDSIYVQGLATMFTFWFGGSVGVNLIKSYSEKKVEIAKLAGNTTTVSMPENVSTVSAKTTKKGK